MKHGVRHRRLDVIDYMILYTVYSLREDLTSRAISNILAYAVMIKSRRFDPLIEYARHFKISMVSWVMVDDLWARLYSLAKWGLIVLLRGISKFLVVRAPPRPRIDPRQYLPAEVEFRLNEAIEVYRSKGLQGLIKDFSDITGLTVTLMHGPFHGKTLDKYIEVFRRLSSIKSPCPECPSTDEFLEMRRQIKDFPT